MMANWRNLLSLTVDEDMARVEGVPVVGTRILLMLLLALLIAGAIRTVDVLLITSLLVMPAASARRLAKTPKQMAAIAAVLGAIAMIGGLTLSWQADTPIRPSIVLAATVMFIATLVKKSS